MVEKKNVTMNEEYFAKDDEQVVVDNAMSAEDTTSPLGDNLVANNELAKAAEGNVAGLPIEPAIITKQSVNYVRDESDDMVEQPIAKTDEPIPGYAQPAIGAEPTPRRSKKTKMRIIIIAVVTLLAIAGGIVLGFAIQRKNACPTPVGLNNLFEINNIKGKLITYETAIEGGVIAEITYKSLTGNDYYVYFYETEEQAIEMENVANGRGIYPKVMRRKTSVYMGALSGAEVFKAYRPDMDK